MRGAYGFKCGHIPVLYGRTTLAEYDPYTVILHNCVLLCVCAFVTVYTPGLLGKGIILMVTSTYLSCVVAYVYVQHTQTWKCDTTWEEIRMHNLYDQRCKFVKSERPFIRGTCDRGCRYYVTCCGILQTTTWYSRVPFRWSS